MRHATRVGLLLAMACESSGPYTYDDLEITLEQPAYGAFEGDGPVVVAGTVNLPRAVVRVNGQLVDVGVNGRFETVVPLGGPYENIDVQAAHHDRSARSYVPVFRGNDPLDTWPDALTARITEAGLAKIGSGLGEQIDALNWADQLLAALPSVDTDVVTIVPTAVTHSPTDVVLRPADDGLDVGIGFRDLTLEMDGTLTVFGQSYDAPITVGYGVVELGARAIPYVDDEGMIYLELTDAFLELGEPDVTIGSFDGWLIELLLEGISWVLEPVSEFLLTFVLDAFPEFELGGPVAFDSDLMGTPLEIRLSEVTGDPWGLALGLGVGIGESIEPGPLSIPAPLPTSDMAEDTHLVVGLHEGLIQSLLSEGLVDALAQDIKLAGALGAVIESGIRSIPGGEAAPYDADGWCLSLEPGTAHAVRLQEGIDPLGMLYLPDVRVEIGQLIGQGCLPWLEASVAMEVGLVVREGTEIGIDLAVAEGAVFAYATDAEWEEDEVVEGLGSVVEGLVGALGGSFAIDLADVLGGGDAGDGLGALAPSALAILDSQPMAPIDGQAWEGLYAVSMRVWE